jgi:uncharacterized protein (DUF488 family)
MDMHPIATIGYEGVNIDDFIRTLKSAKIDMVLDVRAVPLSRKPGFSKNKLATRLESEGIRYIGLKGLGTPVEGRVAARAGRTNDMRAIFKKYLQTKDAKFELSEAAAIAKANRACLLCYEHDHAICHRDIICERIAKKNRQTVRHLDPYMADFL